MYQVKLDGKRGEKVLLVPNRGKKPPKPLCLPPTNKAQIWS